jgi:hypothetical protein
MTRRLALAGFAAVAVLWGPYVYSEWVRAPLRPVPDPLPELVEPSVPMPAPEPAVTELGAATAEEAPEPEPEAPSEPHEPGEAVEPAAAEATPPTQPPQPAPAAVVPAPQPAQAPTDEVAQAAPPAEPSEEAPTDPAPPANDLAEAPAPSPDSLAPAFRSAFDREARDASWAGHEETRLTGLLTTVGVPEALVSEVRCQSTVCRISFNAGDTPPELRSALLERARSELGPGFALDTSPMAESEPHASLYVLRKGYDLEPR